MLFGHSLLKIRVPDTLYQLYKNVVSEANKSKQEGSKISLTELTRAVLSAHDKTSLLAVATAIENTSRKPFQLTDELKAQLDKPAEWAQELLDSDLACLDRLISNKKCLFFHTNFGSNN